MKNVPSNFRPSALVGLFLLAVSVAPPASADLIAVTAPTSYNTGSWSVDMGFQFTANANINVTQLGQMDFSGQGLADGYTVSLWDDIGALLGSIGLASGTGATLDSGYRFGALASGVSLSSGSTYRVSSRRTGGGSQTSIFSSVGQTIASEISILAGALDDGGGSFPEFITTNNPPKYLNVSFKFGDRQSVPVPATLALFGLGLAGLGWSKRKKA